MNKKSSLSKLVALSSLIFGLSLATTFKLSAPVSATTRETTAIISTAKQQKTQLLAQQTAKIDPLTAILQGCNRQGTNLDCIVQFIAHDNHDIGIYCNTSSSRRTILTDSSGNEYACIQANIGNIDVFERHFGRRFRKGVPTKIVFTFKEIPREINNITSLEIYIYTPGKHYLQFQNIQISG